MLKKKRKNQCGESNLRLIILTEEEEKKIFFFNAKGQLKRIIVMYLVF